MLFRSDTKAVVLGEGMGAVKIAARALQSQGIDAKWYQAWGKNFPQNRPMTPAELQAALNRNERWIRLKIDEGFAFYDLGFDPTRSVRSRFYELEQSLIREARAVGKTVKTIPILRSN